MKKTLLAAALACMALPAAAQNSLWLNDSALSRMTREDTLLFGKTAKEAMTHPDGYTTTWTNPKTGASGTITVLSTSNEKGMLCRTFSTFAIAGGVRGDKTMMKACRVGDQWRLAS